jgi:hypothetical protein
MYLVKDIASIIKFEGFHIPGVIVHLMIGISGLLGGITVLLAQRNQKLTPDMKLVISLVCADILLCSSVIVYDISNLAGGGWVYGGTGCAIHAMFMIGCCFASVFTLLAITIERYRSILLSTRVTDTQAYWMIFTIWFTSLFIVFIPVATQSTGTAYGLNAGLLVCTISWYEWSPAPLFMTSLVFITFIIVTSVISFVYTKIVVSYLSIQRKVHKSGTSGTDTMSSAGKNGSSKSEASGGYTKQQQQLIIKSAVLTASFFFCWAPYMVKLLYEISTGTSIPSQWDIFCTMGAFSNSVVNPFLLIFLDARIRKGAFGLFGSSK